MPHAQFGGYFCPSSFTMFFFPPLHVLHSTILHILQYQFNYIEIIFLRECDFLSVFITYQINTNLLIIFHTIQQHISMYNRNTFKTYQSMNLILKNENGGELWLGDYYSATDLSLLSQKNIKAVLTVAANMEISYPAEIEIKHKIINALDLPTYKMNPHFVISNKFIHGSLQKGENILVHCAAGISRSVTCVIAYLMKKKQYGYKQALIYVQNRRSVANPNYGFELELKNYYEKVCSERKKAQFKINEKEKNKTAACLRPKIKKQENKLIKSFGRENIGKLPPIQNSWKDEKVYQPKIVIIKK